MLKGETSGHVQDVCEIRYDCDADCLLIKVIQTGAACHTMERSCFYRLLYSPVEAEKLVSDSGIGPVLDGLFTVLEQRREELPEGSYTTKLLTDPQDKLLAKIAEEATEVVIAARDAAAGTGDIGALHYELADLIYHVLVVMVREGVSLEDLAAELERRKG